VVTGIASGTSSQQLVILSGFILVIVEAVSMAAGTYLSNKADLELQRLRRHRNHRGTPVFGSLVMGVAYIVGGAVPLSPYFLVPLGPGLWLSILSTALVLFIIGFFKGQITRTPKVKSGLEMVIVAMSAADGQRSHPHRVMRGDRKRSQARLGWSRIPGLGWHRRYRHDGRRAQIGTETIQAKVDGGR
jgi:predicted membrane protein (TIGR00267 family)